jgi:hypothetical protein
MNQKEMKKQLENMEKEDVYNSASKLLPIFVSTNTGLPKIGMMHLTAKSLKNVLIKFSKKTSKILNYGRLIINVLK